MNSKPPYLHAVLAGACVFALYVLTLAPTTAFWDTSEYMASAHVLGIAHPPGNPLFILLARSWEVLLAPFGLSVAVRINLFSAVMSSLAHMCWFLVVHRILSSFSERASFALVGSAAATLLSATAFTVWNQSNVNEKVYTVSLLTIALISWLIMRWRDAARRERNDNLLVLIVFLFALSVANHLMAVLAAPAIVVFILVVRPRVLLDWRLYALGAGAAVLGLSVHMFLPIRAAKNPLMNEADPKCASTGSAFVSILTLGRAGCPALSDALARRQYSKPSMFSDPVAAGLPVPEHRPRSPALLGAQIANYLQYFDWQWTRSLRGNNNWFGGARPLVTLLFIALGCYGAHANYKRDPASFAYVAVLMITLSFGLVFYLNFRYGYSSPWADPAHATTEVRERDYFFIVSFSIWGLWVGVGLAALWQRFSRSAVMAVAFVPLFANWTWASRSNDYAARDWSYNLLMSVEPYSVLITNGDNDTFPLWYMQEVEGVRTDVTVIVGSYLNTSWYVRQLRDLSKPCAPGSDAAQDRTRIICQRKFVSPAGTSVYATSDAAGDTHGVSVTDGPPGTRLPKHSILDLTDEQIESMSRTAFISQATTFQAGNLKTEVAAGTEILPADLFLAQIIKSSIEDRPIYFALTSTGYRPLNLQDHLVQRGVALKLVNGDVASDPTRGIYELPAGSPLLPRFVDAPVTEALALKVFVHHPGFPDTWKHWTDIASQDIPFLYAAAIRSAAITYAMRGDSARAFRLVDEAARFERLSNVRAAEAARLSRPRAP